jgi:glucosylceramidase
MCAEAEINTGAVTKPAKVILDPGREYQEISGFGGAFNELGSEALKTVEPSQKEEVMEALFGTSGCNFSSGRTPMGASDFALDAYSLNDVENDFEMKHFSIERDKKCLIPYIREALKKKPGLKVWGCPWSPPYWMKTNSEMCNGGELLDDHRVLSAYAKYFDRYIREYSNEGISISAVCVQNETDVANVYPTSTMPAELMKKFIRAYLVPQLMRTEKKPLKTEIWAGSIRDVPGYADEVVTDPLIKQLVTRIGYQYSTPAVVRDSYEKYPGLRLVHTESPCHNGANSWEEAKEIFNDIADYLENGCESYHYWNMILDETTLSSWDWKQNSMITIDRTTKEVRYNYEYYVMKHYSQFIAPGARRIQADGDYDGRVTAYKNPDGSLVCILMNPTGGEKEISFEVNSVSHGVRLDADSIYTVCIR